MATPSKLTPGAMVRRKGEPTAPIYTFVARHGSKYSCCQCDKYKGLDGPDDPGFVDVSDWDMARKYERDIRAFLDRGGRIERLTADAISNNPNPHGYNDTSREKALRAARRGGATQRRGGV